MYLWTALFSLMVTHSPLIIFLTETFRNALERLRLILDPLNTEALVTSEEFCEAMTNWCQTLESSTEEIENSELNKTPW